MKEIRNKDTSNEYLIDKTEVLEREIVQFPSLYIEGAAASGKSVAIQMMLDKHPEVKSVIFFMKDERKKPSALLEKMKHLQEQRMTEETKDVCWVIFENISQVDSDEVLECIADYIWHLPKNDRVILTGRERPAKVFLHLIWKRKMELLPQEMLLFSKEEVRHFFEQQKCGLQPEEVYEATGGWPGCVDLMRRLAVNRIYDSAFYTVHDFLHCYEVETYIREDILDTLSINENDLMQIGAICPWLNEELCKEVWRVEDVLADLQSLERKGLFVKNHRKKYWQLAPLFRAYYQNPENIKQKQLLSPSWKYLGEWYEKHGYLKEAAWCFQASEDKARLFQYMVAHYEVVPFIGIEYDEVMELEETHPQLCYLRGMWQYDKQNFAGLKAEIAKLKGYIAQEASLMHSDSSIRVEALDRNGVFGGEEQVLPHHKILEILLNLYYVYPEVSMNEWMDILEHLELEEHRFCLYSMLGDSFSFLCGLRDLSELFACTKKEEKRKEQIWNEKLDENAKLAYRLAKIEYYIETEREDLLEEQEQESLWDILWSDEMATSQNIDDYCMASVHLLCKWKQIKVQGNWASSVQKARDYLVRQENERFAQNAEAMYVLFVQENARQETLDRWLKQTGNDSHKIVVEKENFAFLLLQAKGYIFLNHYDKAEKLISQVIPYLQVYRKTLFLAEALFLQALVHWGRGQRNKALRSTIESFVVNGNSRYVGFYTRYGKKGQDVLAHYIEWMEKNAPGGWHRKKKYNYGSVLRMTMEDYLEVILRTAKKDSKYYCGLEELEEEERLTMMESIILQQLSKGLSNAEICEELNLKLPTVKTHIYSLYKKMGVSSRVQAIVKGTELGLLK